MDAQSLAFGDATFDAAFCTFAFMFFPDRGCAFREMRRVLRPGGIFLAVEIPDSWTNRVVHTKSTFVPVSPESGRARLTGAGFSSVRVDSRGGGLRFRATRSLES